MKKFIPLFVVVCFSFILIACSGSPVLNESFNDEGVPTWVENGSKIVKTNNNRLFHGVGSASMMGDFSLQTAAANRQARQEMARIVASYLEIVSRDYIATRKAKLSGFSEQEVMQYIEKVSSMDLSRVDVVGHWKDDKSKKIYAITQMDMQKVRQVVKNLVEMDKGLRVYFDLEGGEIFDRIAVVEDK